MRRKLFLDLEADRVIFLPSIASVNVDSHIRETSKFLKFTPNILSCQYEIFKVLNLKKLLSTSVFSVNNG